METKWSEELRWRFTFNTRPETVNTNVRIVLRAPERTSSALICPSSDPEAVIPYRANELENYFYWTRCESASAFLRTLRETAKGNKLNVDEVEAMFGTPVAGTQPPAKPNQTSYYTPMLKEQYFVARISGKEKDRTIEIWTFAGKKKVR